MDFLACGVVSKHPFISMSDSVGRFASFLSVKIQPAAFSQV